VSRSFDVAGDGRLLYTRDPAIDLKSLTSIRVIQHF